MMSAKGRSIPEANKLVVGEGVIIKGAVLLADTVVVGGLLEGDISVDNLIVNKTGTISGRIAVAGNAEVFGQVLEKLDVKGLLVLRAGGRVDGSVSFGTLTIEQGATVTGEVSSTDYRTNQQSTYRASHQAPRSDTKKEAQTAKPVSTLPPIDLPALDMMPGPIKVTA
jgi:cytoskeletal protein CcmA (bactofilin family)